MLINTYDIALDTTEQNCANSGITLVQNDAKVNKFNIKIFDGSTEIDYAQVTTATITFYKLDENVVQGNLIKTGTGFAYDLGTNEISKPGAVLASVQLMGADGERLTTSRFGFTVVSDLINATAVESTTEFAILQQLQAELEAIDVVALTSKVGTGTLNTTAQNCVEAINEVDTAVDTLASDVGTNTSQIEGLTNVLDTHLLKTEDKFTLKDDLLPFKLKTYALKCQMHCHTTTSDGKYTSAELLAMYKNAGGYDAVCITDHDGLNLNVDVTGIIHIRSSEYFTSSNHNHLCAYNINVLRPDNSESIYDTQSTIDFVRRIGGLTSIPHPQMGAIGINYIEALALENFDMMEIYTAFDNSYYDNFIDNILKKGKQFNLLAVDDFHNETFNTFNGGWIVVNCDSKTQDSILSEIKAGNYYSSNGNNLNLTYSNGVLTANSTNQSNITFITDKTRTTITGTSGSFTLNGDELYIRVESQRVSDSKMAWSNPIFLHKKDINLIHTNIVPDTNDAITSLTKYSAVPERDFLKFVSNLDLATCTFADGVFTISSNCTDTTGKVAGLTFSSYDKKYSGRNIKFSFDVERVYGNGSIQAMFCYSGGDKTDLTCSTNGVLLTKDNLYAPIKSSANNTDNFVHYEISADIPNGIYSVLTQVRLTNIPTATVIKVRNFKVLIDEESENKPKITTKTGIFTHDATVLGTQKVSLPFKAKSLTFFATTQSGAGGTSWGVVDQSLYNCEMNDISATTPDYYYADVSMSIRITTSSGTTTGTVTSIEDDGFTVTWDKVTNSATGTIFVMFLATA